MHKYLLVVLSLFLLSSCFFSSSDTPKVAKPTERPLCTDSGAVRDGAYVRIAYTGTLDDGKVFDSTATSGARTIRIGGGQIPKGFENGLLCMRVNDSKKIDVKPVDAYGEAMIPSEFTREAFGADIVKLKTGEMYEFSPDMKVRILKIGDKTVTVEQPNPHPLAGKILHYEVRVEEIR